MLFSQQGTGHLVDLHKVRDLSGPTDRNKLGVYLFGVAGIQMKATGKAKPLRGSIRAHPPFWLMEMFTREAFAPPFPEPAAWALGASAVTMQKQMVPYFWDKLIWSKDSPMAEVRDATNRVPFCTKKQ